jgi:hypothetical protein
MPNTTNARTKSITLPLSALSSPQTVCLATPSPTLAATPCRVSVSHGVTGERQWRVLRCPPYPQIRAMILRMSSFGSSLVESLMGRVALLLLVMILSGGGGELEFLIKDGYAGWWVIIAGFQKTESRVVPRCCCLHRYVL